MQKEHAQNMQRKHAQCTESNHRTRREHVESMQRACTEHAEWVCRECAAEAAWNAWRVCTWGTRRERARRLQAVSAAERVCRAHTAFREESQRRAQGNTHRACSVGIGHA